MEVPESGAEKGFLQGRASRRVVHALKYPELPKRFRPKRPHTKAR